MSKQTLEVDPFSINLEDFATESVGHAHTINLPASKELRFQCDFAGDFELGVKVIGSDGSLRWRRNSYEGGQEGLIQAIQSDRTFVFEGVRKICWYRTQLGRCSTLPWIACPAMVLVKETVDEIEIAWDDSREPYQYRNIGCRIIIG
jgi:hypothetical protein